MNENIIGVDTERRFQAMYRDRIRLATVVANNGSEVQVSWNTPSGTVTKTFPKITGVAVVAGEVVLMIDATGDAGWVVIGKVIHN